MRVRTRILTSNLAKLYRSIRSLSFDWRPAWVDQIPIVEKAFEEIISAGNFKPISKATRAWRKRRGFSTSAPPLNAGGRLLKSTQKGPDNIEEPTRKYLVKGTKVPYAAPNHFGATVTLRYKSPAQKLSGKGRKSKTILGRIIIPARPFTPENEPGFITKTANAMRDFLLRFIQKNMEKPQ